MVSAHEIREILRRGNSKEIADTHLRVFGDDIDRRCSSCYNDARARLNARANELERANSPIHLYISVYQDADPKRQLELEECLWQNENNPHIEKVIRITGDRPTYQDFFNLFSDDVVNVIVNSDIFFDETIRLAKSIKANQCYALNRYEWNGNGHATIYERSDSQDAWIFRGKIKKQMQADFPLGVPGCDNRIAYEIKKAGYVISNPCKSIHALHYHTSQVRHYNRTTPAVPQPYHFVHPCAL